MLLRNQRIVDLSAIKNNISLIRASLPSDTALMAVVKADGYGHGAVETAKASLEGGAEMLAVASVGEGLQLREAGIVSPILVLGAVTQTDVIQGVAHDLIQTVCSPEMVYLCEDAAEKLEKQTEVHLKVDSGMGRIGVRNIKEKDLVLNALAKCKRVILKGVFTHFSDADGDEDGVRYTQQQFRLFTDITASLPGHILRHCANSAAIHRFPDMALDMVRAGISLYGYPPVKTELSLKPCMSWKAKISYIKELPPGCFVSYGRDYRSDREIRVATVTCGYADGYFRAAGKDGYVLIRGQRAKILGRICMDQMMVDISGIQEASVGDEVILIGKSGSEQITAEDIARWAGTISYEVLLSVGSRVEKVYIQNQSNAEETKR